MIVVCIISYLFGITGSAPTLIIFRQNIMHLFLFKLILHLPTVYPIEIFVIYAIQHHSLTHISQQCTSKTFQIVISLLSVKTQLYLPLNNKMVCYTCHSQYYCSYQKLLFCISWISRSKVIVRLLRR